MENSWGAVFDFDGVVVNTEWHHEVCWQQVAKERNQPLTHEQYVAGFGVKNDRFISEILGWTTDPEEIKQISVRKEEIFQKHAQKNSIELIQGILEFLHQLEKHGIPCAIASSSILKNIHIVLEHSPAKRFFSEIVSGEDVKVGKPNPACFLRAAEKLHLPPDRCIVFEDALLGVEAASKAGSKVVAITTTFPKREFEELPFRLMKIVPHFGELNVEEIDSWFA